MTGNSHNSSLLDILGRYKPAPWRGRYSLSRLFFNFYLLVMGSFVVIAFFADFVISAAVKGITDDYTSRFMQGTIVLIEDELFRKPRSEWPNTIKALDNKFSYRLEIVDRWSLKLSKKQAEKLDAGELAIDSDRDILYHRLKLTPKILVVGPLSPDANPDRPRALPLELRIHLLTWSLISLILAIAVWLWVRPVWRDLETLRQTARALGEGHFETRAPNARNQAFDLLTETLNGMAERIQRLIATQKELSSAISHELRTPIARMRFALEMLSEADDCTDRQRLMQMMDVDLDELDSLIDSSLTYARFEREQPELQLSSVELLPWIEDEVDSMRILGGAIQIAVDNSGLPVGQRVELDQKSMPYAVTNLLRNAIKYAKSKIVISAEVVGDRICLHVDDDGIGIPPEERKRVFYAFTRLDRSRDRATGGYGLGLAIVRLVLEQHGGSATVEESPLGGARFTLSWPLLQSVTQS
ncbi:ATP-binding protein [Propionivibrio sp.]|uniref:ATP-binding protein n=1 Tax=Propionivibrio sp. TaxID=2212460 RepID=UPI0025FF1C4C|nr:ATP-binding protein [Propionivibrio sp.]MBK7355773.1 two-component sensor histidine kinase [Propionivibrio sp.]MBK8400563.1 two-component sensor histidine kinase [Propionivibrio sp.]MBK8744364.1 two-component sensor histidine kinase [Propionivibrio sp.]MBK8895172.1 two-component sensor histidine kinase [Propionivibrio sp.]